MSEAGTIVRGDGISPAAAERLIAHAAAHGAAAARALGPAWGLTAAAIDRFCRDNQTAIARRRLALAGRKAGGTPGAAP